MRIITLHSDFIEFEPKQKAIKTVEKIEMKRQRFEEVLVVLTAVEKRDEAEPRNTAAALAEEVQKVAKDVKVKRIVLYPYVHLISDPAKPSVAKEVLEQAEALLKKAGYEAAHAPFGYYKQFVISVKGHPLAELSREIGAVPGTAKIEEELSGALQEEEKVKSEWFVMSAEGQLTSADKFDFKKWPNLHAFYKHEVAKQRAAPEEPPHVKLMQALEIAGHEPGSDSGNMRWYPKGRLIKSLLEMWVTRKAIDYGAVEVETPIMYDYEHPALKSYLDRFPARQYVVRSAKKDFFLRFAACFGQFLMLAAATISYKDLPLRIYELTRYSFRLEKAGELSGLRRLRAFTMPDMHTLCSDLKQAKHEFANQFTFCMGLMGDIGLKSAEYEAAVRFTDDFWKENPGFVEGLAKTFNKPILIERWNRRFAYFDPKFEFNFVDALGKAAALSTVQIDHENGKRFNILFTDSDNQRKHPFILHNSPSGAIERVIYALLERAHLEAKAGKNPSFPLWLSPTQVRLCPVNDTFNKWADEIANQLASANIRADVDDRVETIQRKVRDAEIEWVPLIVVLGDKEKKSGKLAVRFRETGKVENKSMDELVMHVQSLTTGFPFKPLPLPRHLTKRPKFAV